MLNWRGKTRRRKGVWICLRGSGSLYKRTPSRVLIGSREIGNTRTAISIMHTNPRFHTASFVSEFSFPPPFFGFFGLFLDLRALMRMTSPSLTWQAYSLGNLNPSRTLCLLTATEDGSARKWFQAWRLLDGEVELRIGFRESSKKPRTLQTTPVQCRLLYEECARARKPI